MSGVSEESIPVYVIHLASQPERWDVLRESLSRFPRLRPVVVDAVDGRSVPEDVRTRDVSPDYPQWTGLPGMTAGEWGCATSHRKAHGALLGSGAPFAVVLEDDVLLSSDTQKAVFAAMPLLDRPEPCVILLSCRVIAFREPLIRSGRFSLYPVLEGAGGYGYALNRTAAERLMSCLYPFRTPGDWWSPVRRIGVQVLALSPHVASYREGPRTDSTIETDRQTLWRRESGFRIPLRHWPGYFANRLLPIVRRKFLSRTGRLVFLDKTWE